MDEIAPYSTLKRPPAKLLRSFNLRQIGDDRVSTFLQNNWSLAICCRDCSRLIEWTPPMLAEKFRGKETARIADIGSRLACTGERGCGSHEIAVWPHPHDRAWTWDGPAAG
ncbi:hypothetical protein [Phenylobacterium montanum]|uniref:Uncharacterized protein n=1 Tax=Phenylobacterium montanum TaxID=2823693 RepID=A0A975FWW1_9CAUL|nr:hypothetical protein [Caulobacter sp. S6]QUD86968.1 hypothetical protein KCG34_18095 [Caulobacter sp. S6]